MNWLEPPDSNFNWKSHSNLKKHAKKKSCECLHTTYTHEEGAI